MRILFDSVRIGEEEVAGGGVINVASVQALDHEVSWKAKVFTDFNRLFVYDLGGEVFCDAAVVDVAELVLVVLVVEKVVYVDKIDIALNVGSVNPFLIRLLIRSLGCLSSRIFYCICLLLLLVFGFLRRSIVLRIALHIICLFEPRVAKYLRDGKSLRGFQLNHPRNKLLGLFRESVGESKLASKNEFVQLFECRCLERYSSTQHGKEQHA